MGGDGLRVGRTAAVSDDINGIGIHPSDASVRFPMPAGCGRSPWRREPPSTRDVGSSLSAWGNSASSSRDLLNS